MAIYLYIPIEQIYWLDILCEFVVPNQIKKEIMYIELKLWTYYF